MVWQQRHKPFLSRFDYESNSILHRRQAAYLGYWRDRLKISIKANGLRFLVLIFV
jgi:hypothetical protein